MTQKVWVWMVILATAMMVALVMATAAPAAEDAGQEVRFFRIGTGATGGSYFPVGGLIANAISNPPGSLDCLKGGSCGVPGLIATAVATQGSVENVKAVAGGELDMALTQANVAYDASIGTGPFAEQGPLTNLRAVANLFPEAVHLVVRDDSGIQDISDLKGKRVSLGEPDSGARVVADIILDAYGLKQTDFQPFFEQVGTAGDMLVADELDAYFMVSGYPMNAIAQTANSIPIRLVQIFGPEVDEIRKKFSFIGTDVVPEGTYTGVGDTVTLKIGAELVVSASSDDDLIYGVTRALWHKNNRKLLDTGHPLGKRIELHKALDGLAIPLHPGAARYYREVGLTPVDG